MGIKKWIDEQSERVIDIRPDQTSSGLTIETKTSDFHPAGNLRKLFYHP